MNAEIINRLILLAYEQGWHHACTDHQIQRGDSTHPIGACKRRDVEPILAELDPNNLLGLR